MEKSGKGSPMDDLKRQQQESFNRKYGGAGAGMLPRTGVAQWHWEADLRWGLRLAGGSVSGITGLSICSGAGEEAEWFAAQGARMTATDLSPEAVRRIRERNPEIRAEVADAEHLPYPDRSFDFAIIRHGLHHLPRPYLGMYEMLRVARRFVILWEAQDSGLMRCLAGGNLFGLLPSGGKTEPYGNYVYRFSRRDLQKIALGLFLPPVRIHCSWHHDNIAVERWHRIMFPDRAGLALAKVFYATIDALFGRWGNNIIAVFPLESEGVTSSPEGKASA
jgi:hypothetical protein